MTINDGRPISSLGGAETQIHRTSTRRCGTWALATVALMVSLALNVVLLTNPSGCRLNRSGISDGARSVTHASMLAQMERKISSVGDYDATLEPLSSTAVPSTGITATATTSETSSPSDSPQSATTSFFDMVIDHTTFDTFATAGGKHRDEVGFVGNLDRRPSRHSSGLVWYDPDLDAALEAGASPGSPVPKPSWSIHIRPDRTVSLDEIAFAYDLWYEMEQVFQYTHWLGVPIQQDGNDILAIQDMIWRVKPDLIVELGTNTGGGAIFYRSIQRVYNPRGLVVTLDLTSSPRDWHQEAASASTRRHQQQRGGACPGCVLGQQHPWWLDGSIVFVQGDVTQNVTRDKVDRYVRRARRVLVIDDASHEFPSTLHNMEAVMDWVSVGSYLLVQDTKLDRIAAWLKASRGGQRKSKRPWVYHGGPMRAVDEFIKRHRDAFVVDRRFEYLGYSQHHRGFLRRIR